MTPCQLIYTVVILATVLLSCTVQAQYDDVRCKCVCPRVASTDSSGSSTNKSRIFIQTFTEPSRCKCEHVIDKTYPLENCDRCDCQWQRRNTVTIKFVVIFIVCVVALLFLYMLFLLCLDPLMNKRSTAAYEQHNDEASMTYMAPPPDHFATSAGGGAGREDRSGVISRVRSGVDRITGEQERWKGAVEEQRRHIYERHTMLN